MQTVLPDAITSPEEADKFLTDLFNNGESFHPDDSAHEVNWDLGYIPSEEECEHLNKLMQDVLAIPGYDPYILLLQLSSPLFK